MGDCCGGLLWWEEVETPRWRGGGGGIYTERLFVGGRKSLPEVTMATSRGGLNIIVHD